MRLSQIRLTHNPILEANNETTVVIAVVIAGSKRRTIAQQMHQRVKGTVAQSIQVGWGRLNVHVVVVVVVVAAAMRARNMDGSELNNLGSIQRRRRPSVVIDQQRNGVGCQLRRCKKRIVVFHGCFIALIHQEIAFDGLHQSEASSQKVSLKLTVSGF